jgi:hypothetical protein
MLPEVEVRLGAAVMALLASVAGCSLSDSDTYTLYRTSVVLPDARLHVGTFDAADGGERYNRENCEQALELFQAQPGIKTRFWCEKGRFRK